MNGDHGGSQCGLTSLLPMSCRGRAAAFARDLHSRLRNLGGSQDDDGESSWLTRDAVAARPNNTSQREADTFYDFELECESPSSPVDEYDIPFPDKATTDEQEPPFYDVESDPEFKEHANKLSKLQQNKTKTNGFRFSTAFYSDSSPVKIQPISRENGHVDKRLYSPITFEGCARKDSTDEIDCVARPSPADENERLTLTTSTLDSDSEFESAKSDPSDGLDEDFEIAKEVENEKSNCIENTDDIESTSLLDSESIQENIEIDVDKDIPDISDGNNNDTSLEIITCDVIEDKEPSPKPEIDVSLLNVESNIEDLEIEDDRPQRVRRCSSLKTGKTPPGTPGRKKIVRFADVLGLDLADVKTFMDEIPVIPKSAYDDLTGCDFIQNSPPVHTSQRVGVLTLVPLFQLPRDTTEKIESQNVCLELARVGDGSHITICGSVRVRNLDYHKTVHVRYTMDKWKTYTDLQATYIPSSCDGYSDRFQFVIYAPCISVGQRLELAVRFQCKGQQFWDNNKGANYCFDCLALGAMPNMPIPSPGPLHYTVDWHPSFY